MNYYHLPLILLSPPRMHFCLLLLSFSTSPICSGLQDIPFWIRVLTSLINPPTHHCSLFNQVMSDIQRFQEPHCSNCITFLTFLTKCIACRINTVFPSLKYKHSKSWPSQKPQSCFPHVVFLDLPIKTTSPPQAHLSFAYLNHCLLIIPSPHQL